MRLIVIFCFLLIFLASCKKDVRTEKLCLEYSSTELTIPDSLTLINCHNEMLSLSIVEEGGNALNPAYNSVMNPGDTSIVHFSMPNTYVLFYVKARDLGTASAETLLITVD